MSNGKLKENSCSQSYRRGLVATWNPSRLLRFTSPGNGNVGFLQRNFRCSLGGGHRRLDSLAELSGPDKEEMLLFVGCYQDVVLVLALLSRPVLNIFELIKLEHFSVCLSWLKCIN